MKALLSLFLFIAFISVGYAQSDSIKGSNLKADTTKIILGKKEIRIVESEKGTDIKVRSKEDFENEEPNNEFSKSERSARFKGHWRALEVGLNNYLNRNHSMSLSGSDEFMSLNTARSINVNLNLFQKSVGIIGNQFGFVTGLGFEFYNYFFDNNNSITKDANGVIIPVTYDPIHLEKSKLSMTYLVVPLMFEFQFPGNVKDSERLRMSAGIVGGLKLRSHTKVVYYKEGNREKDKIWNDFNLNSMRYGFTARVGYKHFNVYSNYYPVSLFEKNKGPELYPISVGIAITFN